MLNFLHTHIIATSLTTMKLMQMFAFQCLVSYQLD